MSGQKLLAHSALIAATIKAFIADRNHDPLSAHHSSEVILNGLLQNSGVNSPPPHQG